MARRRVDKRLAKFCSSDRAMDAFSILSCLPDVVKPASSVVLFFVSFVRIVQMIVRVIQERPINLKGKPDVTS